MATTFALEQIRVVTRVGATSHELWAGIEDASETYSKGALLQDDAGGGELSAAADDETAITLVGVAASAATGTTGAVVQYEPLVPGTIVEMNLTAGVDTDHVYALTDLYTAFGTTLNTDGTYTIDTGQTTAANVAWVPFRVVRGKDSTTYDESEGAVGDTNVRVLAICVQSAFIRNVA